MAGGAPFNLNKVTKTFTWTHLISHTLKKGRVRSLLCQICNSLHFKLLLLLTSLLLFVCAFKLKLLIAISCRACHLDDMCAQTWDRNL